MSGTYDGLAPSQVCPLLAVMPILVSHQAKQYVWDNFLVLFETISVTDGDKERENVRGMAAT